MNDTLKECQSEALDILALIKILHFVFSSDHTDEVDNLQLNSLLEVIHSRLQALINKLDAELLKNYLEKQ